MVPGTHGLRPTPWAQKSSETLRSETLDITCRTKVGSYAEFVRSSTKACCKQPCAVSAISVCDAMRAMKRARLGKERGTSIGGRTTKLLFYFLMGFPTALESGIFVKMGL